MNDQLVIREYKRRDKADVINLIRLNTPRYFAADEEDDLRYYLDNERELYFVLIFEGRTVGCGGINLDDNDTIGKISWDIFHPDFQRKSLGTQLLNYRIEKLRSIESIQKISVRTSQAAFKFYQKRGFELKEIVKDYWAKGYDLYNMEYKYR